MSSNSDNSHVISIEEDPDKTKKNLEIVCSPNMIYVATLDEDSNINLWSVVSQEQHLENKKTIHIDNIYNIDDIYSIYKFKRVFAISDNMHASISLNRVYPYNFGIFDFENEQEILLTFHDQQKEIDFLSFLKNGDIVIVNVRYYRAYVFSCKEKDNISWD
ncbi:18342_t:CDS:2, partial [Dentiscutata erythropus]